ncbi:hypothetical protein CLG94_11165 [Candidatus Methylomirabilis limnetica]|uniref:Uncharacterized protein n=1 Tax=Candidatus Methylomirabilis limnetica TaxID=2033718 RepID=A0A2T4TVW1_9BACT|nr:hypothetical protein [Candidatus Methylomirabilis limnetica]PTL35251.1 hypothetical protein CLG94_11165 [Candidatus Methylomirabilis limnetica]
MEAKAREEKVAAERQESQDSMSQESRRFEDEETDLLVLEIKPYWQTLPKDSRNYIRRFLYKALTV